MSKKIIEKTIDINTTPVNVWRVFTDSAITRQMGGEYVTDWKVGSPFGWKGKDGKMYTHGEILQVEPGLLLKHKLFDIENKSQLLSVITYKFIEKKGMTTLQAKEELNYTMTDDQYKEASDGWDFALQAVKENAEKL